jgi:hypothetical protein
MGSVALLDGALLGGFVVVALPVIIHLLSRRRARRVAFAPIELLLRSQKRTARSIRLRQLLLLLVRTLLLAALAGALVRPLLVEKPLAELTRAPVAVVLAVDVSASMHTTLDGKEAFARAKDKARETLTKLVDDVRVGLVACDDHPRDVVAPTFERREVLAALDRLEAGWAFADVGACVTRAAALARTVQAGVQGGADGVAGGGDGERRVVVISDLAAHAFPGAVPVEDGAGLRVDLVAAFDEEPPPNHAIVDVDARPGAQGLAVRFHAARWGGPDVEIPADLQVGDRRVSRLSLPFSSGRLLDRAFTATLLPADDEGVAVDARTLTLSLGDDALAADNVVVLPREPSNAVRVLVVDGEADPLPFSDEAFYLTQALTASRAGAGGGRIAVSVTVPEKLDASSLVDVDVLVLANVARLDPAAAAAVVSHVEAGAGLFVTMGDQVDVDAWNRDLGRVLPAVLRGTKGQALLDDASVAEVLGLTRFKSDHPVLRAFASSGTDAIPGLSRVRTTTTMLVEPDSSAPREVLARFTNDAPALIERAVGPDGRGRVLLLATSIDREWTDLPIRPGFLPLVEQVALYLGRALDDTRPRTVHIGEARTIRVPPRTRAVVVVPPTGREERIDVEGDAREVRFVDVARPGLHRVFAVDEAGARTALADERFTALIDARESDPTRLSAERTDDVLPRGAVVRRGGDDTPGTPVWPWLFVSAALFLVVEGLLLRRSGAA